jgi:hypothetical protein
MDKVQGLIAQQDGDVVYGAQIQVSTWPAGSAVTLYEDDEVTQKPNPLTTDSNGEYEFNVPDGTYQLQITQGSTVTTVEKLIVRDVRWDRVLLGKLLGADFNTTNDQAISLFRIGSGKCIVTDIIVANASINLSTAQGGFYTGAGKTGTTIVASTQAYNAVDLSNDKWLALTLASAAGTDVISSLYFALTTAQGSAATADIYVYGYALSS